MRNFDEDYNKYCYTTTDWNTNYDWEIKQRILFMQIIWNVKCGVGTFYSTVYKADYKQRLMFPYTYTCKNLDFLKEEIDNGDIKGLYEKLPIQVLFQRYSIVRKM